MRVLIINKFLYPNGGSETYIFKLGEALEQHGHEVQYFGMEHEGRCVGNRVNAYTSGMDFHGGSKLSKLTYPIKTIYSKEARVQLRKVLDDFKLNGTVIVTYRCNARCSMCNRYKAPSKPEEEISIETIKKLPKMYFTNITGGEPFIRTDLKDIVRELYKKSDRIVISTNGCFQCGRHPGDGSER